MTTIRVLAPYFMPAVNGGGPIRTLDALTASAPPEMQLEVVTRDRDLGADDRLDVPRTPVVSGNRHVQYLDSRGPLGVSRLVRAVCSDPHPDLVYLNSVFDPRFAVLPLVLRRLGLVPSSRFLVAPRGEFDPGALALKASKKRRYLALGLRCGLFRGVVWHASTELEAANIRAVIGATADIVIRENETSLPDVAARTPLPPSDRLELVTVGRISPKKRLHLIIEALAGVVQPVRLTVLGPADDAAYARRCSTAAALLPANVRVDFVGSRSHAEVLRLVGNAHAMATATAGENFGHTIAEALAVGRPVLLPDTTPWSARVLAGGGEVVADDAWTDVINRWAAAPREELNSRALSAADAYDAWRSTGSAAHVFEMALGRG